MLSKFFKITCLLLLLTGATQASTFSFGYSNSSFPLSVSTSYSSGYYGGYYGGFYSGYYGLGYSSLFYPRIPVGPHYYRWISPPQLSYDQLYRLNSYTVRLTEAKRATYYAQKEAQEKTQIKIEDVKINIDEGVEKKINDTKSEFSPKEISVSADETVVMKSY